MNRRNEEIVLKIPRNVHQRMLEDLKRPHMYAYERVGFLFAKCKKINENIILLIANDYQPVIDEDYIEDPKVGAKINSHAIRSAMQKVLDEDYSCFHVHMHSHSNNPSPSLTDLASLPDVVMSLSNVNSKQYHGFLILSNDSFYCEIKKANIRKFIKPDLISVVGYPMHFQFLNQSKLKRENAFTRRQTFLGSNSEQVFENVRIGIVGYGGGGSHIGQQLAHIGFKNFIVFDFDKVEDTNLNRLVGAKFKDLKKNTRKVDVAKRTLKAILPSIKVNCVNERWQNRPELLQECDVVFGCVDTYHERSQLEAECRRHFIPYIDIGMDVISVEDNAPNIVGQVILSMPGMICMRCMGYLTEDKLSKEAMKYGAVGGRPQVVWPNGVLASTAVGILTDILTGWTKKSDKHFYLSYDGNLGTIIEHIRLKFLSNNCNHYKVENAGPPKFKKL